MRKPKSSSGSRCASLLGQFNPQAFDRMRTIVQLLLKCVLLVTPYVMVRSPANYKRLSGLISYSTVEDEHHGQHQVEQSSEISQPSSL